MLRELPKTDSRKKLIIGAVSGAVAVAAIALVVVLVGGRDSEPTIETPVFDPATSVACEQLREYAFVGFPTSYVSEGQAMLADTSFLFSVEGQFEAAQEVDFISRQMGDGPVGQLNAGNRLRALANQVC